MAGQINYVPLLPKDPPEDLVSWALGQGALNEEYLIYKSGRRYLPLEDRTEDCVEVTCSACGNSFYADKVKAGGYHNAYAPAPFGWWNEMASESVISGSSTICPYCGCGMETKHIGDIASVITQRKWVAVVSRLSVEGEKDRLAIVDWMIARDIDKNGHDNFWTHLHSAWIVEEKKIVRIAGHCGRWYTTSLNRPEQRRCYRDTFEKAQLIYPWNPEILDGTTAENSKLDRYIAAGGERIVAYLGLYLKKPAVENLVMQGMAPLVKELLDTECARIEYRQTGGYPKLQDWIDWKEKKPSKMLGMNRDELRIFKENGWGKSQLSVIAWARAEGIDLNWPEDVECIQERGLYDCRRIIEGQPREHFWKNLRYLKRCGYNYDYLRDYWDMAKKLQMDLEDEQVKWPKDIKDAHDKAVERYNAQKDALTSAAFEKRAKELARLRWEHEGLMIRPCATAQELRNEGKELHHCVATYDQRYARGETAIFFIRRADKPDEPYFTLELDEKNLIVRQNRGLRNCARTEEVEKFEAAWLDWARKEAKKPKKRKVKAA